MKLDQYDLKLLDLLTSNSKLTITELSEACGLTRTPVFERIRKMEEHSVIVGYKAKVDLEEIGFSIHAFCNVSLKEHSKAFLTTFEEEIVAHKEVITCHHIAGMFDYLLEIRVKDMQAYQTLISEKLAGMENIGNVQSSFVMKAIRQDSAPLNPKTR
jgi:Lrp/AsnC family leucine-responsive transcriptional regulator